MKKYRTQSWNNRIEPVECERETESSVWINGIRHANMTTSNCFFDTFEDAKAHLIEYAEIKVQSANSALNRAKKTLEIIKGLKEK